MAWQYRQSKCSYCNYPAVTHIGADNYCARHASMNDGPRYERLAREAWGKLQSMIGEAEANKWHDDVWPNGYGNDLWSDIANKVQGKIDRLENPVPAHTPMRMLQ